MLRPVLGGFVLAICVAGSLSSCGGKSFTEDGGSGAGGTAGAGATSGSAMGGSSTGGGSSGGISTGASGNRGGSAGTGSPAGGFSGTSETGGSGGTTAGGGATAGGGTTGGSGEMGGVGGAGGEPSVCSLPPDAGPCRGSMRRFAFIPSTGVCHPFTYGGCEGNANNFETIEECYGACGGQGEIDPAACRYPTDCKLVPARCCGPCQGADLTNTVAVNATQAEVFSQAMSCHLIDCASCTPTPNPWLGATCRGGRCVAFDARETELTECQVAEDCRFRAGLGCCEACSASRESFIAVNGEADVRSWVCGDPAAVCAGCVPIVPPNLSTVCTGNRCGVLDAELPQ